MYIKESLIAACALAIALLGSPVYAGLAGNTSDVSATFTFGYTGADDGLGGDETFGVEFEGLPESFTDALFDNAVGGGFSSTSASHTMDGLSLNDDMLDIENIFGADYDDSFPDIVVQVDANATAPDFDDMASVNQTEQTVIPTFVYFGSATDLTLNFDFNITWDMIFDNGLPGFTAGGLSVIAYLLDNGIAVQEFNVTPCPGCLQMDPSIGLGNGLLGVSTHDETGIFGGPVSMGSFSFTIDDIENSSGNFSVLVETNFSAFADVDPVPLPGAIWLLGSALVAAGAARRHKKINRP